MAAVGCSLLASSSLFFNGRVSSGRVFPENLDLTAGDAEKVTTSTLCLYVPSK